MIKWLQFEEKYRYKYTYYYDVNENITRRTSTLCIGDQFTPHEAKALAAFSKLLKLRRDWIGEWEPDWENGEQKKYVIECIGLGIRTYIQGTYRRNLSFPTQQMAHEFLETFHDLIEEAKILI